MFRLPYLKVLQNMKADPSVKTVLGELEDDSFSRKVICRDYGNAFRRKTWNSTDENLKRRV